MIAAILSWIPETVVVAVVAVGTAIGAAGEAVYDGVKDLVVCDEKAKPPPVDPALLIHRPMKVIDPPPPPPPAD